MESGKKKSLLPFAVVIIIIAAAIVAFDYYSRKTAEKEKYIETPEGLVDKEYYDLTQTDTNDSVPIITAEKLAKEVERLERTYPGDMNREKREQYISQTAIVAKNAQPCAKLATNYIREDCYYAIAVDTNNAKLCESIIDGRTDCYLEIAEKLGNEEICEKANFEYEICLEAARKKDESLCKQVSVDAMDYCSRAAFPGCTNAEMEGCNDSGDSFPPGDVNECSRIMDYRGICYYRVATANEKPSLCEKAPENARNECYSQIGIASNKPSACNLAGELRDNCITWIAINTNNLELCSEIVGAGKETCIEDVKTLGGEM